MTGRVRACSATVDPFHREAPLPAQLLPLPREQLEIDLNRIFEGAFEAAAGVARAAIEALEPLMNA